VDLHTLALTHRGPLPGRCAALAAHRAEIWVRLNKRTETAIDRYDSEIGRFLCMSSSKKGLDIETIFLAEKVGFYGFN
jgi:hypothetical protein